MRLPRQGYKRARIEIIPMIDTVFFLLVFFMVASLSMSMDTGMRVNVPKARTSTREALTKVTVSITAADEIFIDKRQIPMAGLGNALQQRLRDNPQVVVVINADEHVEHGKVVAVMDAAKTAGASRLAIATRAG